MATLRHVYGGVEAGYRRRRVLGSVKSNIGHAMPAAGAAGLIKAVLAAHHGVLPPTLHGQDPHPGLADTGFGLLDRAEPWSCDDGPRRAGVNAFGFGGINAHVVVEEHRDPARRHLGSRRRPGPASGADQTAPAAHPGFHTDTLLLAGRDAADLADQLAAASQRSDELRPLVPASAGPARLAIVEPTAKRLELAARVLEKGRPWRGRNDVWFEPRGLVADGGRVAFLYPGVEPAFDADLTDVADWLGTPIPPMPEGATDLERQGREIFGAGRLLHAALDELGIVADEVAGHSLGEWTGVFTAELIPATQADAFLDDLEPGALETPGVVFVALGCGAEVAQSVIADVEGVSVSHDNCPHQSVICGPESAMDAVVARFAARKVIARPLPFRSGFHSPHFAPYLDLVRHHWARMPLQPARTPMWSATTCERYPTEPDAVRQLALDHLVQPVRFRELTERLHDAGVRAFVQLGVGSLTAFADDTLKGRDQLTISAASPTSGLEQLVRVGAALWVEGVDVRLERLLSPAGQASLPTPPEVSPEGRAGPTIRLSLGAPLLRLPDSAASGLRPPGPSAVVGGGIGASPYPSSSALEAEFDALVAETMTAGQEVTAALARRGSGPQPGAIDEWRETLEVSIDTFPWLVDHCFYRQPDGWDDPADRFPVLPMTTMVEMLGQAAARLSPDLVVVRIDNVRASRWLTAAPPTPVVIKARRRGPHEVEASIEGYVRATVHLGAEAEPTPAPRAGALRNPRPSPVAPGPLYADHWMFHGPTFQGVRAIDALGDDGVDGQIEVLPTPGAFLDNAGQLYGWWVMATADADFLALPQSIERIEFFGPPLASGATVDTKVRIVDLDPRTVRADLELVHDGRVAVRITGWVDRRFDSDAALWLMLRQPEHHLLATPVDAGYVAVEERWRDSASRELMARRYLDAAERAEYQALNPQAQRRWLLGRIAAKDAVRHALWSGGNGARFPIEVPLESQADRPATETDLDGDCVVVRGGPAHGWRVAIGVAPGIGVAVVDRSVIRVACVDADPTGQAARLADELAAVTPAGTTIATDRLAAPVHLTVTPDATSDAGSHDPDTRPGPALAVSKEYVVAWTTSG